MSSAEREAYLAANKDKGNKRYVESTHCLGASQLISPQTRLSIYPLAIERGIAPDPAGLGLRTTIYTYIKHTINITNIPSETWNTAKVPFQSLKYIQHRVTYSPITYSHPSSPIHTSCNLPAGTSTLAPTPCVSFFTSPPCSEALSSGYVTVMLPWTMRWVVSPPCLCGG